MPHPPSHLHVNTESSSICCSSISESLPSLVASPTAAETKKKVTGRKYSKMAFIVKRLKKSDDVNDDVSLASLDSSLSSGDLFEPHKNKDCIVTFQQRKNKKGVIAKSSRKDVFQQTRNNIFGKREYPGRQICDIVVEEEEGEDEKEKSGGGYGVYGVYGGFGRYGGQDKSKRNARQNKYSKLAFSVKHVGSTTVKNRVRRKNIKQRK